MATGYSRAWHDEKVAKLLETMLQGVITEIKPQLDSQSGMGFSFPSMSQLLSATDKESAAILESLADEGILLRKFFDKFLFLLVGLGAREFEAGYAVQIAFVFFLGRFRQRFYYRQFRKFVIRRWQG